ncbi:hypothetical protein CVT24_000903 [Panaeolus cyanescens]|uniref:Anaphase-promoting complex subunit 2 n=1 Tax=Panaeolus cyanescens TaxID=181874 RepID=A0A409YYC1_9AGAR|nr:hypothetical protein CVT24_000903 [Panaeolus cyanescens]
MATEALRQQVATKWQESFNRLNNNAPGITGLLNYSEAWAYAVKFLRPWDIRQPRVVEGHELDINVAKRAFNFVSQARRLPALLETFLEDLRRSFYLVENEINEYIAKYEAEQDVQYIWDLISRMMEWYMAWLPSSELALVIRSTYTLTFQTYLFAALPATFSIGFKNLCATLLCPPPDTNLCLTKDSTDELWKNVESLALLERYESVIASVGYEYIEQHVLETCAQKWEKPMLEVLRKWMSDEVVPWMLSVYARGAKDPQDAQRMLQGVGSRFDFHINKILCDLRCGFSADETSFALRIRATIRTKEIFDIIVDYPDSAGALQDLKDCLQRVDQRENLVKSLRKSNAKRLLHPGAMTKTILQQYVSIIKCLRIIDPPGVLLFKVADPIRRYLRERPDTIRCIVSNLVGDDENGDSIIDESEPIQPFQQPEVEDYLDPNWEPEPIDAGPEFRTNKPSDVLSTLVSIYDSKDLFVKELQVLLAQRLLAITKDNTEQVEKERRNIEILKIRFGEAALQVCEVMLRDMTDSKRIDGHVQSQKSSIVHPTIISRHFWPSLETSDMVMPGQFQKLQEEYSQEFNVFKPDKKLKWIPHLGTVNLHLELEDRILELDVPPLEAAFIELFSEKDTWLLDDLISAVGKVDRSAALKALATWIDHGVIKEDPENTFILLEHAEQSGGAAAARGTARLAEVVPDNPPMSAAQQQQAEQMRVYWKFIEGMLTNLGTLPIDRIQAMLRFAPGYNQSVEQLSLFMEAAKREGLVDVKDGMWKLRK